MHAAGQKLSTSRRHKVKSINIINSTDAIAIVIRTQDVHKNPDIPVFLDTVVGADYYVVPHCTETCISLYSLNGLKYAVLVVHYRETYI